MNTHVVREKQTEGMRFRWCTDTYVNVFCIARRKSRTPLNLNSWKSGWEAINSVDVFSAINSKYRPGKKHPCPTAAEGVSGHSAGFFLLLLGPEQVEM